MSKYVGSIDQGTTSTRFILFDREGDIVASEQKEHAQLYPKPGWVEHDPVEIWRNTQSVISGAMAKARLAPEDLSSIGITNQRETTLLWDRATGAPLHNALVWQDTRTDRLVAHFAADGGQDRLRAKTGLPLATYFSGLKLAWLLENVPGARGKAAGRRRLVRQHRQLAGLEPDGRDEGRSSHHRRHQCLAHAAHESGDARLGSRTSFRCSTFRAHACRQIRSSSEIYGACVEPLQGVAIAGILGDQQAALFGQACLRPGEAKNTYGTGCFMLMNTGETPFPSSSGLLTTLGYKLGDARPVFALEGSIAITGALVQWLRDNLGIIATSAEVESLARSVKDNGDVYVVPAFSGLYAPYWQESARGVIAGPHALRQQGAYRPSRARGDRLSSARCARRDGQGFQGRNSRIALRRRHGGQRASHAVPGRYSRRAGGAPESHRNDRAGRRLCGWPRDWLLEEQRRHPGQLAQSTSAGSPPWREANARDSTPLGRKRFPAHSIGRADKGLLKPPGEFCWYRAASAP